MIFLKLERDYCNDCRSFIPRVKEQILEIDEDGNETFNSIVGCAYEFELPKCYRTKSTDIERRCMTIRGKNKVLNEGLGGV